MASVTLRLTSQPSKLPPQRPADSASRQVCLLHHSCFPAPGYLKRFLQRLPVSHTFPVPKKGAGFTTAAWKRRKPRFNFSKQDPSTATIHTHQGRGGWRGTPPFQHRQPDFKTYKSRKIRSWGSGERQCDIVERPCRGTQNHLMALPMHLRLSQGTAPSPRLRTGQQKFAGCLTGRCR